MAFKPFTKIRLVSDGDLTTKNINAMQDNIAKALGQILGKDTLDVAYLQNVSLSVGLNKVPHTLGRSLQGYYTVRSHGNFPLFYDTQDTNPSPNLLLYLMSATAVTVDLIVF